MYVYMHIVKRGAHAECSYKHTQTGTDIQTYAEMYSYDETNLIHTFEDKSNVYIVTYIHEHMHALSA